MANYNLNKTVYNTDKYKKVIDTSLTQYAQPNPTEDTITVEQFFTYYNKIFYDIPAEGNVNSHSYLVKTSGEYAKDPNIDNNIQLLLDEITSLQQQNLILNQQILNMQISSSTNNI